jgi:hypothetical protein
VADGRDADLTTECVHAPLELDGKRRSAEDCAASISKGGVGRGASARRRGGKTGASAEVALVQGLDCMAVRPRHVPVDAVLPQPRARRRARAVRDPHRWHIGDHIAAAPGTGRGRALRARLLPELLPIEDARRVTIHATAASPELAALYMAELPGLVDVGGGMFRGRRRRRPPAV